MVTHDNRILDIADRTINMEDGRLLKSFVVKIEVVMMLKQQWRSSGQTVDD